MSSLSDLTLEEINNRLTHVCDEIALREKQIIEKAGVNTNSTISGFANGSLSVTTENEMELIHQLKLELMHRTPQIAQEARLRNLSRRAARKQARLS